ncbi:MAG: hypothetical protein NUV67_00490 [archaeon]|nr:hypothetical protein [archaeon]
MPKKPVPKINEAHKRLLAMRIGALEREVLATKGIRRNNPNFNLAKFVKTHRQLAAYKAWHKTGKPPSYLVRENVSEEKK